MDVKVTLYPSRDSYNSYNRDSIGLESYNEDVTITIGDRELVVSKADLIAAVRVLEMTGGGV
jgi:hypothetical protein